MQYKTIPNFIHLTTKTLIYSPYSQLVNGPEIVQPYVAAPGVGAIPINPTVTHVGSEHIPGAVAEGEPLPSPGVVHLGKNLFI